MHRTHLSLLAAAVAAALSAAGPALAQDAVTDASAAQADVADGRMTPEELDTLLGPVALYPDTLLSQVLLASTYPLDVVKAARFVDDNAETPDKERATLVEQTGWDPSIQSLAAGFPTLITRMNDNLDWTEQVGDAVLAQTDDVFDSVQRLRDDAAATGYLTTNDAQTVTVTDNDVITIAPTSPEVVYVPTYDSNVVYSQPAPANAVYVNDGNSSDLDDALVTGAMVFGTAMILDNIFDNDDPWDNYWRGPPRVDWDNADFDRPPGVDVNGDVNIGSGNTINRFNRENVNIDRDKINIDRDKVNLDRNGAAREKIGNIDRDQIDRNRDRNFSPDAASQAEARDKINARKASGKPVPSLANLNSPGNRDRVQAAKTGAKSRAASVNTPVQAHREPKANRPAVASRPENVSRPKAANHPKAAQAKHNNSAFKKSGGSRAKAASSRGRSSGGHRRR